MVLADAGLPYDISSFARQAGTNMKVLKSIVEGASTQAALTAAGPGQLAQVSSVASGATTTTAYTYTLWDSADQASITKSSGSSTATTTEHYNAEGFLAEADAIPAGSSTVTKTLYTLSATGLIMLRQQSTGTAAPDTQYFYYAAGRTIGDVSDTRNPDASRMSYAEEWATVTKHGVIDTSQYKTNQPVLAADFDQSYQPINSTYPAATSTNYTVHTGDTLRSIARALWGDADMWYLIAQANNLSASATLVAGQILSIPNKVTNIHNNGNTFRPYDPSEAIGHIDPTLPPPPAPAHGGGCGAIGTVIMVVVAVVATIYTAGVAAEFMGPALASAAGATTMGVGAAALVGGASVVGAIGVTGAIAAAVVGAAVGSITSQLVGNAIGAEKGFSWKQVATAAVGSALTAGFGAELAPTAATVNAGTSAASSGTTVAINASSGLSGTAAVEAAAGSTAVQEALKGEWSWRQLAASTVGAAAGQAAGAAMASAVGAVDASSSATAFAQRLGSSVGSAWSAQQVMATDPRYTQARTGTMFTNALDGAIEGALEDGVVGEISGYEAAQTKQVQIGSASVMPASSAFGNATGSLIGGYPPYSSIPTETLMPDPIQIAMNDVLPGPVNVTFDDNANPMPNGSIDSILRDQGVNDGSPYTMGKILGSVSRIEGGDPTQMGEFGVLNKISNLDKVSATAWYKLPIAGTYDTSVADAAYQGQALSWKDASDNQLLRETNREQFLADANRSQATGASWEDSTPISLEFPATTPANQANGSMQSILRAALPPSVAANSPLADPNAQLWAGTALNFVFAENPALVAGNQQAAALLNGEAARAMAIAQNPNSGFFDTWINQNYAGTVGIYAGAAQVAPTTNGGLMAQLAGVFSPLFEGTAAAETEVAALGNTSTSGGIRLLTPEEMANTWGAGPNVPKTLLDSNGNLPPGIGGTGTPIPMPASLNPNAAAEAFARAAFDGQTPSSMTPIMGNNGSWLAKLPDGTSITFRVAGDASAATDAGTATVEVNNLATKAINNGKVPKFKFPGQ